MDNTIKLISALPGAKVETKAQLDADFIMKNIRHRYDWVIINWLENILVGKNKRLGFKSIALFFLKFLIYRLMAKQLVFVRHNIYPHGLHGREARIATWIIEQAIRLSTVSIVHSGHLEQGKVKYVAHPLYELSALPNEYENDYHVVFGRIIEYKNIHTLLEHWDNRRLIIAGLVEDPVYAERLKQIIQQRNLTNVVLNTGFITDEEATKLVAGSQGLVITHCDADMIVSGSFFFAASLGVPVFALTTPFFEWATQSRNYQGLYAYKSLDALMAGLKQQPAVDRKRISQSAHDLFGNDVVVSAWYSVLNSR
ncbi:hypothetical protein IHQ56_12455 [Methylobacillus flagellatus]|nr:hypothetical protein [Methylobacillus flagellatus]